MVVYGVCVFFFTEPTHLGFHTLLSKTSYCSSVGGGRVGIQILAFLMISTNIQSDQPFLLELICTTIHLALRLSFLTFGHDT